MLVIGLTGPTGAGKSTVSKILASYGFPILDADAIYRELLIPPSECLDALAKQFGARILTPDGTLDRRTLASIAFSSEEELAKLNRIAHFHVMNEVRKQLRELQEKNTDVTVLDAPQLFEAHAEEECNIVISVVASPKIRMERIMRRDGIDAAAAQARMQSQYGDEFFRSHSDYTIENSQSPELLRPTVHKILCEMGVVPT